MEHQISLRQLLFTNQHLIRLEYLKKEGRKEETNKMREKERKKERIPTNSDFQTDEAFV